MEKLLSNPPEADAATVRRLTTNSTPSVDLAAASAAAPPFSSSLAAAPPASLLAGPRQPASVILDREDYALVAALDVGMQNFVVSDPNLQDNPMVFVSAGFCESVRASRYTRAGRLATRSPPSG
jgi:hypothetical protein